MAEKFCHRCKQSKPLSEFGKHKRRADGVQVYCRCCMADIRKERQYDKIRWAEKREHESQRNRAYRKSVADRLKPYDQERHKAYHAANPGIKRKSNIARKHGEKRATPVWADMAKINEIYKLARKMMNDDGIERHVDHVIPLRHPLVCGLHVHTNLDIKSAFENMSKHNKFEVCDG